MAKSMVLVVDDQPEYARLISLSLAREGFEVRTASGGEEAIDLASALHPDVVLLDVNMPGVDGFAVMADLRERWPVPVIMVTGDDALDQRRAGLDRGADDYVTKPFSPKELAARARAVVRRHRGTPDPLQPRSAVDQSTGEDSQRERSAPAPRRRVGRRTTLLLEVLTKNRGRLMYHDELLGHAFGPAFVGDIALLQEEIRRLRRALDVPPLAEGPIRTVRGLGYVFDDDAAPRRSGRAVERRGHKAAHAPDL